MKPSFNQIDIQKIQKKLHALPNPKLAIEVATLRLDFRQWVKSKFELTTAEQTFLNDLNEHFIIEIAVRASNLLALRKQINLTVIELTKNPKIKQL